MWTHIHVPSGFQTYEPNAHKAAIIEIYAPFKYVITVSFWSTLVFAIITIIMTSMNQQTDSIFKCTDIILYCLTNRHNISVTVPCSRSKCMWLQFDHMIPAALGTAELYTGDMSQKATIQSLPLQVHHHSLFLNNWSSSDWLHISVVVITWFNKSHG
jgi:hypothetical protein